MSGVTLSYLFLQFYRYANCSCNLLQVNCLTGSLHLTEYLTWEIKSDPQDLKQAGFLHHINVVGNVKSLTF